MTIQRLTRKTGILLATIFSIFVISQTAWAAIYYVDSTGGSDSNNGMSQSSPWKTIAKVNSSSFNPGDSILFKMGDIWREELNVPSSGTSGNVITFGSYGTGVNPIFSGSALITAGWTRNSANIWKTTVTTQPNIVYFNGTRGTLVASLASISQNFNWFWASNVLYVWSPTDSNPSTYYTSPGIESGSIYDGVLRTNDKSYITINGITIRDGNTTNINVGSNYVTGVVFQNCVVERAQGYGFDLKGFTTAASVTIDHCTIQNNGQWGIYFETMYTAATISNNTVTGNTWLGNLPYSGIEGLLGNANIFGNTIYANISGYTSNETHGIYVGASTIPANIYNNTIYGQSNGDGIKARGSANIYRNVLYGNNGAGIEVGGNGTTNIVVTIYYNVIYGNNKGNNSDGIVEQLADTGAINLTIENNTLYQNSNTSQQEIRITDNIKSLTVLNNIFWSSPTRRTWGLTAQTGTVKIDYNILWRADGNPDIYQNNQETTWTQWQSLGYDKHGVNANPLFTNAGAANFALLSGSPAIKAGVNVGLSVDLTGNQVPSVPDIGANQSQSVALTPPQNVRILPNAS